MKKQKINQICVLVVFTAIIITVSFSKAIAANNPKDPAGAKIISRNYLMLSGSDSEFHSFYAIIYNSGKQGIMDIYLMSADYKWKKVKTWKIEDCYGKKITLTASDFISLYVEDQRVGFSIDSMNKDYVLDGWYYHFPSKSFVPGECGE